jgi:SPP1 family predicted phage head-tail adaptor
MRYGRLDRKIRIQRKTVALDGAGDPVETWSDLVGSVWASVAPVSGDERFSVPEISASQQTEFQVRWSSTVAGLTPKDRILYPVPANTSPEVIPDATIYDVAAVHEIGRRRGLRIIAVRRTDT